MVRRYNVYELSSVLESDKSEEEAKLGNIPESFSGGSRAEDMEQAVTMFDYALELISSGMDSPTIPLLRQFVQIPGLSAQYKPWKVLKGEVKLAGLVFFALSIPGSNQLDLGRVELVGLGQVVLLDFTYTLLSLKLDGVPLQSDKEYSLAIFGLDLYLTSEEYCNSPMPQWLLEKREKGVLEETNKGYLLKGIEANGRILPPTSYIKINMANQPLKKEVLYDTRRKIEFNYV